MNNEVKRILIITDAAGIYIPQIWAEQASHRWDSYSSEDLAILKEGPEHPDYWDAWVTTLDNARYKGPSEHYWTLYQDGDLWTVRDDYEWPDDR